LPAWAFETPKWLQKSRNNACKQLAEELTTDTETFQLLPVQARLPLAVALGLEPKSLGVGPLSRPEAEFVETIRDVRNSHGLSLAALFLTMLSHFLNEARNSNGNTTEFRPRMYTRVLFENADFIDPEPYIKVGSWDAPPREPWAPLTRRHPLGLDDPLGTVWALIETLDTLWKEAGDSLNLYEDFELISWNILRAHHVPSKKVRTILAYCGGITDVGPCGAWPLVMGREIHCDSGYLICSRCAYCCPTHCKNGRGPNGSPFTGR
jgi:hypothetical protein